MRPRTASCRSTVAGGASLRAECTHHALIVKCNPIQSNVNKRAQVFLFARIFCNITFTYKLKHLRFQLTPNENCKEHLDQASVCLDDF